MNLSILIKRASKILPTSLLLLLFVLLFCHFSFPAPDFSAPLKIDLRLSGTFGELRSNHFHAGIDLKSPNGQSGTPVFAAADGYIHRIKVKGGGYGQALYIDHGNGYSSVYAHLDAFTDDLNAYVRAEQYKRASFSVNLFPAANKFRIKKGQQIGLMGNSGHSYGPHLHFEIRKYGVPVNPLRYLKVPDNTRPVFRQIYFHWFNANKTPLHREKAPFLPTPNDTLDVAGGLMGLSVYAYDPQNEGSNKNGIYQLKMYLGGELLFHSKYDKIPFSKTRFANAHMDYAFKQEDNVKPYALFRLPGNELNLYQKAEDNGYFQPFDRPQKVRLVAEDFYGNINELSFFLQRKADKSMHTSKPFQYLVPHQSEKNIVQGRVNIHFPSGALYHDLHFSISQHDGVFDIGSPEVPLHKYLTLEYELRPDQINNKLFLAYCPKNDQVYNAGGKIESKHLVAKFRQFGQYKLEIDTIAPEIKIMSWKQNGPQVEGSWKISDNYPTIGKAKDLSYTARLNNQWTLVTYDAKSQTLKWKEKPNPGEHLLEIIVRDDRGNEERFTKSFSI